MPSWEDYLNKELPVSGPAVPNNKSWDQHLDEVLVPQTTGWIRTPAMAGSALLKGGARVVGLPGDLEDLAMRGSEAIGYPIAAPGEPRMLPTSGEVLGFTHSLGLTDRPDLTPSGNFERYGSAALEGLGSAVALAPFGGPILTNLGAGIAGGVAGEAAREFIPDNEYAPAIAGGLAGGVAGFAGLPSVARSMRPMHTLAGMGLGGELGVIAGHLLGHPDYLSGAVGGTVAALAPVGYQVLKRNPLAPVIGGEAGANALYPPPGGL